MKKALVKQVARHGSGGCAEFFTKEEANVLASAHEWKATLMLAAAFVYSSNIVFATGGEYMTAEPTSSPNEYGDSVKQEFTRV